MKKDFFYLEPDMAEVFQSSGLASFDALWNAKIERVDCPNIARGGWSEVGRIMLEGRHGMQGFYIKRQQNFLCRPLSRPWTTIPVALREWLNITELNVVGIRTLDVACAGRSIDANDRMILVTRALDDYLDMDQWFDEAVGGRKAAMVAIGEIIARLHNSGFMHGCLYPKHVYIKCNEPRNIRLIDLEKCKRVFSSKGGLRDLDTILRRYKSFEKGDQLNILNAYISVSKARWTISALQNEIGHNVVDSQGDT